MQTVKLQMERVTEETSGEWPERVAYQRSGSAKGSRHTKHVNLKQLKLESPNIPRDWLMGYRAFHLQVTGPAPAPRRSNDTIRQDAQLG